MSLDSEKDECENAQFFAEMKEKEKVNFERLIALNLTHEQLLTLAACLLACQFESEKLIDDLFRELDAKQLFISLLGANFKKNSSEMKVAQMKMLRDVRRGLNEAFLSGSMLQKTSAARNSARVKVARDPRQRDKAFVLQCWKEWKADPSRYKNKTKFARDMLDKCQHLESEKKITDWCREWEKSEPS